MLKFTNFNDRTPLYIDPSIKPSRIERTNVGNAHEHTNVYFKQPRSMWSYGETDAFGSMITVMESVDDVHAAYFPEG